MKIPLKLAACAAALAVLAACGDDRGPGGLSGEENEKLNSIAEKMEAEDLTDTSPDHLTLNEQWLEAEEGGPAGDAGAADSPAGNSQ